MARCGYVFITLVRGGAGFGDMNAPLTPTGGFAEVSFTWIEGLTGLKYLHHMDTATLRDILLKTLTDEELTTLCYDHWREVYDAFANGMSRAAKVQRLIEHAERRGELERLRRLVGAGGTDPSPLPPISQADEESALLQRLLHSRTELLMLIKIAEAEGTTPLRLQWMRELHDEIHDLKWALLSK